MIPTAFEIMAYVFAIESYNDYERYGLPYEGGLVDQPWEWKLAVDVVKDALALGTAQARVDAKSKA